MACRSEKGMKTENRGRKVCKRAVAALMLAALMLILPPALCGAAVSGAPETFERKVVAAKLNVYGNDSLSGAPIISYPAGTLLTLTKYKDGVLCVMGKSGVRGYCSPVDLVSPDSLVYTSVPYRLGVDAAGNSLVSDLVDLDYYIYDSDSRLMNGADGITLIQRATLDRLEAAVARIDAKYTVRVMWAYRPSSADPGIGVPSNTGALLKISVRQGDIEWELSDLPAFLSAMESAGFSIADGQTDVFYDNDYTSYLGVDYDTEKLPVFVRKG